MQTDQFAQILLKTWHPLGLKPPGESFRVRGCQDVSADALGIRQGPRKFRFQRQVRPDKPMSQPACIGEEFRPVGTPISSLETDFIQRRFIRGATEADFRNRGFRSGRIHGLIVSGFLQADNLPAA